MATNPAQLMSHVKDADAFEVPGFLGGHLAIPQPFEAMGLPLHLTKFMVLELVAAGLMIAIFVPLARRIATGKPPRGLLWDFFEAMILFLRDQVARPAIGRHDADRFLPYVLTVFFFILFCNLLGMVPWAGSPTGSLSVTGALALIAFCICIGAGMRRFGPLHYWLGQVPPMQLPWYLAVFLMPMIFFIEVLGLCIRHFVLGVRLLANMFAGHLALAVVMGFIAQTANSILWFAVMPSSVFGATAMSLLELFFAFVQAYIFALLSALFIGMAVHQH